MQPSEYKPLTVGDWIVTKLVLMIPMVGLVMLFVWAFSSDTHPSKKTFCQSALVMAAAVFGLVIIALIGFGGLAAIMDHQSRAH